MKLTRCGYPPSSRICHNEALVQRGGHKRKPYIVDVILQDADCAVCNGGLTLVEKAVHDAPAAYRARLCTAGRAVLDELLHGAADRLVHVIGVDVRVTEKLLDGEPGNELHDDVAASVVRKGEVDCRNVDGSVGDGVHSECDFVLCKCLAPGDPHPVFDPGSRPFGRGEGNAVLVKAGRTAEAQDIAWTRETGTAVVNDNVHRVGCSLDTTVGQGLKGKSPACLC